LSRTESQIDFHDFYKYRVSYITEKERNLIFLFVNSLTDKAEHIKKQLIICKSEFLTFFDEILQQPYYDKKVFEVFNPTIDSIHRNLRPKISLVGFSGVGKTTITKLIRADEIPIQHIPTITGDIATIKIGKLHFHLWDFAGQDQFRYLWNNFIKGSDAVLIITDSTIENVEKSKYFLELIKEQATYAQTAVIGNKQDLKDALDPTHIEKILGLKTYSMIAKDPENRIKMIRIIADILEMNAEVSPLLKPLLERDKLTEDAINAIKNADFNMAVLLFDKISDLCIELGDDSLGREFYDKSQKIKDMLKKVGAPPPTPATPIKEKEIKKISPLLRKTQLPGTQKKFDVLNLLRKQKSKNGPKLIEESSDVSFKVKKEKPVQKELIIPQTVQEDRGLKLNPEDFLVKIKPKSIEVDLEDPKYKLITPPFSQMKNVNNHEVPILISPVKLMKEKDNVIGTNSKRNLKKSLIELKIKKANLSKASIDLEMKELMGEITAVELQEKKEKINELLKKIDLQIEELQNLLSD